MIDFLKPVVTKQSGKLVRILCTDRPHKTYPVVGLVDDVVFVWSLEGKALYSNEFQEDLKKFPRKT